MNMLVARMVMVSLVILAASVLGEGEKTVTKISGTITKISGPSVTVQPTQLLKEKPPEVIVSTNEKTTVNGLGKELGMSLADLKVGMEVAVTLGDDGKADVITVVKKQAGEGRK